MREEKYYIFSQNEFLLLLLLAGGESCTVGFCVEETDKGEVAAALTELFSRGLIRRAVEGFAPDGDGELFLEIAVSKYAMFLVAPMGRTAIAYVSSDGMWVCEPIHEGVRMKKWDRRELAKWLLDVGFIEKPFIKDEDVNDLNRFVADEIDSFESTRLFMVERYINGGGLLQIIEIVRYGPVNIIHYKKDDEESFEPYTEEALGRMIEVLFGQKRGDASQMEGKHDHS